MLWRKFNGDPIEMPILAAVENAIKRETQKGFRLKVCIGTDSQVKGQETEFATVIVFLREGHGGFMFIHNVTLSGNSATESGSGAADGGTIYRNGGTTTVANSILNNGTENGTAGNCGGTVTNGLNNIDASNIFNGMYLIRFTSDNGQWVDKLVRQ